MRGRNFFFWSSRPNAMITGPTIMVPNGSGSGAGACCISSLKI